MLGDIGQYSYLTEPELRTARGIAKARFHANRASGVTNSKYGPQSDEQTDLEGICGEFAFCKMFNIMPDLEILPRSSQAGTDYGDAYMYPWGYLGGKIRVDIKTSKYETARLFASIKKKPDSDLVFALMIGEVGMYRFAGFMPSVVLLQNHRQIEMKGYIAYAANQKELMSFEGLREYYANE